MTPGGNNTAVLEK